MKAKVKGEKKFSKFCNELILQKEKEIQKQKKDKEEEMGESYSVVHLIHAGRGSRLHVRSYSSDSPSKTNENN